VAALIAHSLAVTQPDSHQKCESREAFSDGVLAVAITLLVLDLHVDTGGQDSLAHQLWEKWPSFAAYVLSFFVVGVIWVNHHALFALLDRVDRTLLFYNLLLLMFVTTIPFTTATLAANLRAGTADVRTAVLLYGVSMEGMSISYRLLIRRMVKRNLLIVAVDEETGRRAIRRFGIGTLIYPVVVLVGLFSPPAMLALYAALTVFYIIEQTPLLSSNAEPELE
jgi:uncharacterized membrane protein